MKYLKTFFESVDNYKNLHWDNIKIEDVEELLKDVPVIEMPVKDIADKCIHKDKKDKETKERSEASDLKYPIIIIKNEDGSYGDIIDGHHRLLKAINHNVETIKAKELDLKTAPKEYSDIWG